MAKGHYGETCNEATREAIKLLGSRASGQSLFDKVREMGYWTDDNIWQEQISRTINLPASYGHYPDVLPEKRYLFLCEDGDYELYQPARHRRYEQGRRVV